MQCTKVLCPELFPVFGIYFQLVVGEFVCWCSWQVICYFVVITGTVNDVNNSSVIYRNSSNVSFVSPVKFWKLDMSPLCSKQSIFCIFHVYIKYKIFRHIAIFYALDTFTQIRRAVMWLATEFDWASSKRSSICVGKGSAAPLLTSLFSLRQLNPTSFVTDLAVVELRWIVHLQPVDNRPILERPSKAVTFDLNPS